MSARIVFCGVGALGSLAAMACRNLGARLVFVDFDRVDSKNTLSQAFVKQSIGKNKAEALKLQLSNFYGLQSEAFGVRLTAENVEVLTKGASLLVDAFDNHQSRVLLSEHANKAHLPLVHGAISADGTFGMVRWDERFSPDKEDHEGQATCEGGEHLPMIALTSATLARAIQDFVQGGAMRDSIVSKNAVREI